MFEKINDDRCYVIAEIGGNFTGFEDGAALIDAAAAAGADCVKLQTYRAKTMTSKKAVFDMESTGKISQFDYFKKYELSRELHERIIAHINTRGLDWFSTPSHRSDLDMLLELGMKAIKIGADDATNLPFLRYAAKTMLPVVLSTGMCSMEEVREAVETIGAAGNKKIVILHTVSGYPTYPEEVNLNVLNTYKKEFPEYYIGFSDHTLTPLASIAAAIMGADVIERHFTLDKNAEGPDHMISATPEEMRYIVGSIREIEKMKGSPEKRPFGSEANNRLNNRKSVVAVKNISKGALIAKSDVDIKRPGTGIEPKHLDQVIGKRARRNIGADDILSWDDLG